MFAFIEDLVANPDAHAETWVKLRARNVTTDQINAHLRNWNGDVSKRREAKKWWRERARIIKSWKLFEAWMAENKSMIDKFNQDFDLAVKVVSKRLRALAKTPVSP